MEEHYYDKTIGSFTVGRVVKYRSRVGHVVGFALNSEREVIIVVQFPEHVSYKDGETKVEYDIQVIHPSLLTLS